MEAYASDQASAGQRFEAVAGQVFWLLWPRTICPKRLPAAGLEPVTFKELMSLTALLNNLHQSLMREGWNQFMSVKNFFSVKLGARSVFGLYQQCLSFLVRFVGLFFLRFNDKWSKWQTMCSYFTIFIIKWLRGIAWNEVSRQKLFIVIDGYVLLF